MANSVVSSEIRWLHLRLFITDEFVVLGELLLQLLGLLALSLLNLLGFHLSSLFLIF